MFGTLDDFSRRPAEFRPRGDVLAGSLRPPERWRSTVAQNRKLSRRARLAPTLVGPAGSNCRWLDSSGYIGNLCSRETGLNFYISNEMGRVSASPFRPPRRFRLGAEFGIRREGLIFPNIYSLRLLQLIRVNHSSL